MRYLGALLLLAVAAYTVKSYRKYSLRGIEEAEGFLCLLDRLYDGVFCYLRTPAESIGDLSILALDELGFLPLEESETSLKNAFAKVKGKSAMTEEQKTLLSDFFDKVGQGYYENEIRSIAYTRERLQEMTAKEKGERAKRQKTVSALCFAAALSLCVLLI